MSYSACDFVDDVAGMFINNGLFTHADIEGAEDTAIVAGLVIGNTRKMLDALESAAKLAETARRYFPKSIRNADRFALEQTCAAINAAKGQA